MKSISANTSSNLGKLGHDGGGNHVTQNDAIEIGKTCLKKARRRPCLFPVLLGFGFHPKKLIPEEFQTSLS